MAIYSSRILLLAAFLLVTLCPFTTASTRHHILKGHGGVKNLESPMMDQPRSLRRKKNLSDLQYSSTVGRLFESTTSATSAAPIASVTSNSVVHFTSAPTASPTKTKSEMPSLAPTLVPGRTEDPTADPTNSPTIFPSTSPSTPPTTVQSMNSALSEEETAKQSKIIFLSTFLGVYVLLGGGMAIRWLWR